MKQLGTVKLIICPAYAGVIPDWGILDRVHHDLSRVCGGDPHLCYINLYLPQFVPRMRG